MLAERLAPGGRSAMKTAWEQAMKLSPLGLVLPTALALATAVGCYTGSAVDANRGPAPSVDTEETEPEAESDRTTTPEGEAEESSSEPKGLPCEVDELLETSCRSCHGAEPSNGAENSLVTWADLASVIDVALERMKSTRRPMPPKGKLSSSRISVLEKWVADGMPRGTCGAPPPDEKPTKPPPKPEEPTERDAGKDAEPAPTVCTSGTTAEPGTSPVMRPGQGCIGCHTGAGGPAFEIAGTVYPTLHEPNNCNGASGVKVLIIDANGGMVSLTTNAAGNFMRSSSFPKPYRALVVKGNEVREMKTPQTEGDCNSCHTERGKNGAPGRVMSP